MKEKHDEAAHPGNGNTLQLTVFGPICQFAMDRLAAAFCARVHLRHARQEDGADGRVQQEREWGAHVYDRQLASRTNLPTPPASARWWLFCAHPPHFPQNLEGLMNAMFRGFTRAGGQWNFSLKHRQHRPTKQNSRPDSLHREAILLRSQYGSNDLSDNRVCLVLPPGDWSMVRITSRQRLWFAV